MCVDDAGQHLTYYHCKIGISDIFSLRIKKESVIINKPSHPSLIFTLGKRINNIRLTTTDNRVTSPGPVTKAMGLTIEDSKGIETWVYVQVYWL